jgi:Protein of unknown function (DUF3038)
MRSPLTPPTLKDLTVTKKPDHKQLDNIKAHLELIFLALESVAKINPDHILTTAKQLHLDTKITNQWELCPLQQSIQQKKSSARQKKLTLEEAKFLVLIICHLANQNQELIRRGVTLLEESLSQNQPPHQVSLLADYLDKFISTYQTRIEENDTNNDNLEQLALKLLIDLLFYSDKNGHRRLWLSLL